MTVRLGTDSFGQQIFDAGPLLLKTPATVGTAPTNANSITLKFTDSINEFIEVKLGHDSSGKLLVGALDGTFAYDLDEVVDAWDGLGRSDSDINTLADARVNAKVPQQFRSDANVAGQLFQVTEFWAGTATQLAAHTRKAGGIYIVTG